MLHYKIDEKKLRRYILERGYRNLSHFIDKHKLNRATIYHYFKGHGPFSETYYEVCEVLGLDPLELLVPMLEEIKIPHIEELSEVIKGVLQHMPTLTLCLLWAQKEDKPDFEWHIGVIRGTDPLSTFDFLGVQGVVDNLGQYTERKIHLYNLDQATGDFLKSLKQEPVFIGGNPSNWNYFRGMLAGMLRVA